MMIYRIRATVRRLRDSLRVWAAALWDADNERHGYSIKNKIRRTKEQIKKYIPLYMKCTGHFQFMLYREERITHNNYFTEQ
jgi:hypothetical protein